MKKLAWTVAVAALVLTVSTAGSSLQATEAQTLTGSFLWNNEDQTGDLEAIFTPTGKNTWDVAFHFDWEGEPRTFAGTAEGNLMKGKLSGRVETDGERKSTFVFEGKFKNGKFEGTHAGVRDGEERPTGTLTLNR